MIDLTQFIARVTRVVTNHNRIVLLVGLVLTAGVAFGVTQDPGGTTAGVDDDAIGDSAEYQAAEYIQERYGQDNSSNASSSDVRATVYVQGDSTSVLTKDALLSVLAYQREVTNTTAVESALVADGIEGPPNRVATYLANESQPDLATQYAALDNATPSAVAAAVNATLTGDTYTQFYLPSSYEAGTGTAEALRFSLPIAPDAVDDGSVPEDVQETLHETAQSYDTPDIFTVGQFALAELNQSYLIDTLWLVLPMILFVLLIVLGFAYRDVTDVFIGFIGSLIALAWTFGLMGWMGLLGQQTALIVPVLIVALSIDFGFHVFMRYREQRGPDDGIRSSLATSTAGVAVAFLLVTITAAIGFLANLGSPLPLIRELGVAITLGVVASLIIFTTIVPALKVSADGLWERFGFDRQAAPLGKGAYLSRVLGSGATIAQRGAVIVLLLSLLVGVAGGVAFTELDREPYQQTEIDEVPEWQTNLPGPLAFDSVESETAQQFAYTQEAFQADQEGITEGGTGYTQMLVRGEESVATPAALNTIATGHAAADTADPEIVLNQGGDVGVISPLSVMRATAATNATFNQSFDAADPNDDGIPETNVTALFDTLFTVAPDRAAQVIERTDDGSYRSLLLSVPATPTSGTDRAETMRQIADEMASTSSYSTIAVGVAMLNEAELGQITQGIISTLLIALVGVFLTLLVVYRVVHGTATLGALTVLPIGLALAIVFGGMYLFEQPLTVFTALLISITIGLGIDYNIHISDRFAQEFERSGDAKQALHTAVTGTGGALLGSAVTSGGAFALLIVVPSPQFTSFGAIVAMALGGSFLLSVFVLPSLLYLWSQYHPGPAP